MAIEDTWSEWLVQVNDWRPLLEAQPSYLLSQLVYILAGVVTLIHAFSKGGRWPYFWLGTVLHGLYADNFWHFVLPEYDNFWHSQTPIMLLGARLPLHIIFLYPAFIYHAAFAVSKLNLPNYAEPFATGLVTVLIDIPYDIVAVKFVHWTWHDTDPNIYDRHYWVPWNSYYFHSTFTASFVFFFHFFRKWLTNTTTTKWESAGKWREWTALILTVLFGMPGGVLLFVPIYHPLHDNLRIHSEVTFFLLFSIFASLTFLGLLSKRSANTTRTSQMTIFDILLILQLLLHYLTYIFIVLYFKPENEVSVGLHEPVGPCNEMASLVTPFGQTLSKRKYFCPTDYNEDYFDFHCVDKKPANGASWYTICGTPFENQNEYIVVLTAIIVVATSVFYGLYFKTLAPKTSMKKKNK